MGRSGGIAASLVGALLSTAAAPAPSPVDETPAWARPYLGAWSLYEDGEGGAVCGGTIPRGMAIGGAAIALSATCRRNFPVEEVAGWRLGDGTKGARPPIVLIDALRKPVLTLTPGPEKSWQTALPDGRSLIFERGAPDPPKSLRALMDGTFTLSGPNNAEPCGFAVTARTATGGTLEQAGRCSKRFKGRGWARWSFAAGALTLSDRRGGVLMTLKRADAFTFQAEVAHDMPVFFGPGAIDGSCLPAKDC